MHSRLGFNTDSAGSRTRGIVAAHERGGRATDALAQVSARVFCRASESRWKTFAAKYTAGLLRISTTSAWRRPSRDTASGALRPRAGGPPISTRGVRSRSVADFTPPRTAKDGSSDGQADDALCVTGLRRRCLPHRSSCAANLANNNQLNTSACTGSRGKVIGTY